MKILILGGTRFLGKLVVAELMKLGHALTVISRRKIDDDNQIRYINDERSSALGSLNGEAFDLVLDFICYSADALVDIKRNIKATKYVLVSSTWVPKLWSGTIATDLRCKEFSKSHSLPDVTLRYLNGKLSAEQNLSGLKSNVDKFASLRLPIILGRGDHTGRTDFYVSRIYDGEPIILINGGENIAQVAALESLAPAIAIWSTTIDFGKKLIWEGLPHDRRNVREIIVNMATSIGENPRFVSINYDDLIARLPKYLGKEPLWREFAMSVTDANIFNAIRVKPEPFGKLKRDAFCHNILHDPDRILEINLLKGFTRA